MRLALLVTGACILYASLYILGQGYLEQLVAITDILFAINSFIPAIAGASLVKRYGLKGSWPTSFVALTAGLLLYAIGETIWLFLEVVQGIEIPYPSIADVFYIAGYFPMIAGMALYMIPFRSPVATSKIPIVLGVAVLATALSFYPLLQPLIMSESDLLTKALDIAYPALDIVLIALGITGVTIFFTGKIGKAWLLISIGIVLWSISDVLFSYTTLLGIYYSGHVLELPWLFGYLAIAAGLIVHKRAL